MKKKSEPTVSNWKDPDDAPELTQDWFEAADLYKAGKVIRRGRPRVSEPKKLQSFKLSQEVIAAVKASGRGFNARVEAVLRSAFIEKKSW
jgi:uncharacterized protein (DUF4415 family)